MSLSPISLPQAPFPPAQYFPCLCQEEALARLEYLTEHRRRFGVLTGPTGGGKSRLLRHFAGQIAQPGRRVVVSSLQGVSVTEFVWRLCGQLDLHLSTVQPVFALWKSLGERVREIGLEGDDLVLLLDDVDRAPDETVDLVGRLAGGELTTTRQLTVVTATSIEHAPAAISLFDRADLSIEIEPWEVEDIAGYIDFAIALTGSDPDLFTDTALLKIYELAESNLRRVDRLGNLTLAIAAAGQLDSIDDAVVALAAEELGLPRPIAA
jgi:type II secretory pathway predicted ATPase ExeA